MARKRKGDPVHGWVNFDKPIEMTSTQAVGRIRRIFNAQKAGHAGTLDPLATGILPIALGEATKTVPFTMDAAKSYTFTVTWGESTDTCDAEGDVINTSNVRPTQADIESALAQFIGEISQVPPRYSAIKIDGKRAYDMARAGEAVDIPSRIVRVDDLRLVSHTEIATTLHVDCGKGTYVRSIARDLSTVLGTCGHVTFLRRTRVGPFDLGHAFTLDALEKLCHRGGVLEGLMPVETVLDDIPVLIATDTQARELKHGRAIAHTANHLASAKTDDPNRVLVMHSGTALALCDTDGAFIRPRRVFQI